MPEITRQFEIILAAAQLILAMVGIGSTLAPKDFSALLLAPRSLLIGTFIQMSVPTGMALILARLGWVEPSVLVALMLCAAAPGGSTSNVFTHLAKGNASLSVSITILTSLLSMATIPAFLSAVESSAAAVDIRNPTGRLILEVVAFLIPPMLAGMAFRRAFPGRAQAFSKWCVRLSLFAVLVLVAGALASGRMDFRAFGARNASATLAFLVTHVCVAIAALAAARIPFRDGVAICMEAAVRNGSLALLVKAIVIPSYAVQGPDQALFTILFYTGLQTPLALFITYICKRIAANADAVPAAAVEPAR